MELETRYLDYNLICENVHEYYIDSIVKILNDKLENHNDYYCKAVEDNYKLYKFEV